MATGTMLDLRRTDLRSNVLENPYWITSGEINPACDDKDAVLFSFPITKLVSPGYGAGLILIHQMAVEVITAFDGTAVIIVGVGSLVTDDITTDGIVTDVGSVDEYFQDGDIVEEAIGWNVPSGGNYFALMAAFTQTAYAQIVPADTTVLCIEAQLTGGEITVGAARVHVLISEIPAAG